MRQSCRVCPGCSTCGMRDEGFAQAPAQRVALGRGSRRAAASGEKAAKDVLIKPGCSRSSSHGPWHGDSIPCELSARRPQMARARTLRLGGAAGKGNPHRAGTRVRAAGQSATPYAVVRGHWSCAHVLCAHDPVLLMSPPNNAIEPSRRPPPLPPTTTSTTAAVPWPPPPPPRPTPPA